MKFTFAPEATPLAGYTIKRAIDRGGFGEVYFALSDSGKEVALKLLQHNQQVELRGVQQCLNLKHPNLVTIYDIRTDADQDHWVIMEFVSGKSLELVLDESPRGLPLPEVDAWLSGIASGIGFLHDRGIVHRDLKPANVFREHGIVKIGDVGLSKFITPSRRSAQTESVGTVYYMAPEVARGKYGSELDIYSLGVILYELLTGRVPFEGESTGEILMKHLTEPPDLAPLPAELRPVLARALEKDPQRRTPSALQLAEEFRRAVPALSAAAPATGHRFAETLPPLPQGSHPPAANGGAVNGTGANGSRPVGNAGGATRGDLYGRTYRPSEAAARGNSAVDPKTGAGKAADVATGFDFVYREICRKPWLGIALVVVVLTLHPGLGFRFFRQGIPLPGLLIPVAFVYVIVWLARNLRRIMPGGFNGPPGGRRGWQSHSGPTGGAVRTAQNAPVPVATASPAVSLPILRPAPPPPPVRPAPPVAVPVNGAGPAQGARPKPIPPKAYAATYTPNTPRSIALRTRLADVSWSMTWAVFWSLIATAAAGMAASAWPILGPASTGLADPGRVGLFAITTILGAWGILLQSKFCEGCGPETSQRRLLSTLIGAGVGAAAWWISTTLWAEPHFDSLFPGLFTRVFEYPLLTSTRQPTLAGYITFFATLFALRRWWWQGDAFRPNRLRLRSFVWSGVVAFFVPALFPFPQGWGVCWALAISAVVQLSAPWIVPQQRPALVESKSAPALHA